MTNAPAGWYQDPDTPASLRWWDGARWTEHRAPAPGSPPASPAPTTESTRAGMSTSTWIWIGSISAGFLILAVAIGVGPATLMLALFAIVLAIIALTGRRVAWMRSPMLKILTLAAGIVLLIGGTAATAATAPSRAPTSLADLNGPTTATRQPTRTPTPTPTPAPRSRQAEVAVEEAIPFELTSQDDAARDVGTSAVIQQGANGTRTITYLVTYVDGVESKRAVIADVVTVAAIPELTAIGTRQPAPAPVAGSGGGCDANYTGACVPIAADVDCAGGSGNGPAYVQGPVRIVGSDIYDLDRDGDGIACDR